ncbi:MAG: DNA-binding response regulator [Alphaproteobacteria bacterium]|nr:response regulator transcription factor [Beijerinckiaceae bacterium]NBQ39283.1 DNA-binding response regulator [Alphaproteobacteria bacterium]
MRIVIADDHPLVRGALRTSITALLGPVEIIEAGSFEELAPAFSGGDIDLVLLDLTMPGVQGFSGLLYLRASHPATPVIIVSGNEDRTVIRRCIELGASGYIPKSLDGAAMGSAIQQVLDGGSWTPDDIDLTSAPDATTSDMVRRLASLTPQQVRVLMMLSTGLLNKQIAYELSVSEATVKAHVSAILQKLDVDSRTQAVIAASKIASGQWNTVQDMSQ